MRRRLRRGRKRKGKKGRELQYSICQRNQDDGQRSLLITKEAESVCTLASKGAEKTGTTKMAPKDIEGKPFQK